MALPYVEVCGSHDREAWLEHRLTGIGASEISMVLNKNRWKSALWLYALKRGDIREEDQEQSEAAYWGTRLERLVAEEFTLRSQKEHRWHGRLLRSKEHPWALATLDARVVGEKRPLECKTTTVYLEKEWVEGTPEYYQYQTQQQMLVTGADSVYAACLIGGQRFVWDVVERNDEMIREIIEVGSAFWARVQEGNAPVADGSESSLEALEALRARQLIDPDKVVPLGSEFDDLDAEMQALNERMKAADTRIREIKARVMQVIAERGGLYGHTPFGTQFEIKHVVKAPYQVKAQEYDYLMRKRPKNDQKRQAG